jgi:hypothetical protein
MTRNCTYKEIEDALRTAQNALASVTTDDHDLAELVLAAEQAIRKAKANVKDKED